MIGLRRLFARGSRAAAAPTLADALRSAQDAALSRRREGRQHRQSAALRREAAKHHDQFTRDPIIRALRPDLITTGEKHQ